MCLSVRRMHNDFPSTMDVQVKKRHPNTAGMRSSLLAGRPFFGPQQPVRSTKLQALRRHLRSLRERVQRYLLP